MEPEGSLPHSQQPATCSCSEPDRFSPCLHTTSRRSILILSVHLRLGSFKWSPSPRFLHQNPACNCRLPIRATCPTHMSSTFDHPNNIWWGVQSRKLLIVQSSPVSYYLVPFRPKYPPQHPILEKPSAYVTPPVWATKFDTHTKQQAKL